MTPLKLPRLLTHLLTHPLTHPLIHLRAWPEDSQHASRRNAMVACTALAQRRAEREDVEDFLAGMAAQAEPVDRTAQ